MAHKILGAMHPSKLHLLIVSCHLLFFNLVNDIHSLSLSSLWWIYISLKSNMDCLFDGYLGQMSSSFPIKVTLSNVYFPMFSCLNVSDMILGHSSNISGTILWFVYLISRGERILLNHVTHCRKIYCSTFVV